MKHAKKNGKERKKYDMEEVHVLIQQAADKAAEAAIKKTNSAWKKRLRQKDAHLMDDVRNRYDRLGLDELSLDDSDSD